MVAEHEEYLVPCLRRLPGHIDEQRGLRERQRGPGVHTLRQLGYSTVTHRCAVMQSFGTATTHRRMRWLPEKPGSMM
jgi:hypothetical protein